VELDGDGEATITMTATVPIAHPTCGDITFEYDHAVVGQSDGFDQSDCEAYFKEGRLEHTLRLRVEPAPGCNSYTSLMEFMPFDRPPQNMWTGYVPSNITVRLQ